MAQERSGATKYLVVGGLAIGGGLAAYGTYRLFNWMQEREKKKWELIQEYIREAEELKEFLAGCIERGTITDTEREYIKASQAEMDQKQINIESYSTHWFIDLVEELGEWGKKWGLYVILPTIALAGVSLCGFFIWKLLKKYPLSKKVRPPATGSSPMPPPPDTPPPPYICPVEGCMLPFETQAKLATHIQTLHPITTNLNMLLNAQTAFNTTSEFARTLVATEAGLYDAIYVNWTLIGIGALVAIVVAIGIVLSMGTAVPGVITAAGSVVAQAEAVALKYQVATALVAVAA